MQGILPNSFGWHENRFQNAEFSRHRAGIEGRIEVLLTKSKTVDACSGSHKCKCEITASALREVNDPVQIIKVDESTTTGVV